MLTHSLRATTIPPIVSIYFTSFYNFEVIGKRNHRYDYETQTWKSDIIELNFVCNIKVFIIIIIKGVTKIPREILTSQMNDRLWILQHKFHK